MSNGMSWLEQYRALSSYNQQMNRKLYGAADRLSDEERKRDRGAFFGSIHATFNHLLLADRIWMLRLTGDDARFGLRDEAGQPLRVQSLAQQLFADYATLRQERERTDRDIVDYVAALTETDLTQEMTYTRGQTQVVHVRWWALTHFFNHQTHHRGQITTLLTQAGVDVGVTDFIAWLRDPRGFAQA